MHKRNIALIASLIAAAITVIVTLWSAVHRSDALTFVYFPAILLSVIFSGMSREIGATAEWSASIVYALFYVVIFIVIYALLLEAYLLRSSLRLWRERAAVDRVDDAAPQSTFENLGEAIAAVEARRRTHWVLSNTDSIDLNESPDVLGARALEGSLAAGPAKGVLKHLKSTLQERHGASEAEGVFAQLKADATEHLRNRGAEIS
jgi:hypothetical protein